MKPSLISSSSNTSVNYGSCDESPSSSQDSQVQETTLTKPQDKWLGVTKHRTRTIPGTNYFLSRVGKAVVPSTLAEPRLNAHGYDKDNPRGAMGLYEKTHPKPAYKRALHFINDTIFNAVTCCVPAALSMSAGKDKQRIDQNQLLSITRESVDRFPQLKIRISEDAFALLDPRDQMEWHRNMSIIRAAQHDYIVNELEKLYPGHINKEAPTILYTGGRATGYLRVIYCSMDEYVALYWSDFGLQSTDSGSYRAHVYDYVIEGENQNWAAQNLSFNPSNFETTPPGEYTFLGEGDRKIWSFKGPCAMVDHGIGDIPSMAKFALVSNVFSTLNFSAIGTLLTEQGKAVAREYKQRVKEVFGCTPVELKPFARVSEEELQAAIEYFEPIMQRAHEANLD